MQVSKFLFEMLTLTKPEIYPEYSQSLSMGLLTVKFCAKPQEALGYINILSFLILINLVCMPPYARPR